MENSNLAAFRPTRNLVALVSTLALVQVPMIVLQRVLAVTRNLAPSATQFFAAKAFPVAVAILWILGIARSVSWLVVVHRLATNTIARGGYLRDSPNRMVLNYFLPIFSVFAPRVDMLALIAANDRRDRSPDESLSLRAQVNAWWIASLGSGFVFLVLMCDPSSTLLRGMVVIADTVFSIAFLVFGTQVLRGVEARIEPEALDFDEVFA